MTQYSFTYNGVTYSANKETMDKLNRISAAENEANNHLTDVMGTGSQQEIDAAKAKSNYYSKLFDEEVENIKQGKLEKPVATSKEPTPFKKTSTTQVPVKNKPGDKVSTKSIGKLYFPDEIMLPSLEYKRMNIIMYESNPQSNMVKQLLKISKDDIKIITDTATNAISSNNPGDVISNGLNSIAKEVTDFNGTPEVSVVLPIPNELSDSMSNDYSQTDGIAKQLLSKIPGYSLANDMLGKAAAAMSEQRIIANPGYFQNYTGTTPRNFSFSFDFIPNSKEEAKKIIEIIMTLKKHASPKLVSGAFLQAPNFFWFFFSNNTLQKLTKIRPCIIKSIDTNYSGSSVLETTLDGMPKHIILKIEIAELRAVTKDRWD